MREFKGTKGKWYRNTESRIVSSVYSENKESLIHISGRNNEEAKANAQLISKAPEMLEVLEEVFGKIDWSYESFGSTEGLIINSKIEQVLKEATTI